MLSLSGNPAARSYYGPSGRGPSRGDDLRDRGRWLARARKEADLRTYNDLMQRREAMLQKHRDRLAKRQAAAANQMETRRRAAAVRQMETRRRAAAAHQMGSEPGLEAAAPLQVHQMGLEQRWAAAARQMGWEVSLWKTRC